LLRKKEGNKDKKEKGATREKSVQKIWKKK